RPPRRPGRRLRPLVLHPAAGGDPAAVAPGAAPPRVAGRGEGARAPDRRPLRRRRLGPRPPDLAPGGRLPRPRGGQLDLLLVRPRRRPERRGPRPRRRLRLRRRPGETVRIHGQAWGWGPGRGGAAARNNRCLVGLIERSALEQRPGMGQGPHALEEPGAGAPGGAAQPPETTGVSTG